MLFDLGLTFSYVSLYFVSSFDSNSEAPTMPIYVSTPIRYSLVLDQVHRSCVETFAGCKTWIGLIILDMVEFDVLLGLDWLNPYHVVLYCYVKTVILALSGVQRIAWKSMFHSGPKRILSFLQACRLVEKGCLS